MDTKRSLAHGKNVKTLKVPKWVKKETQKYLEQMKKKEAEESFNNPFAALLKDYGKK